LLLLLLLSKIKSFCEQSRQTSSAAQLAVDLPGLMSSADQLNQQPIDVTEYQPTHFWFTESTYRKYLPVDRTTLIGRIDVGAAGISAAGQILPVFGYWFASAQL